MNKTLKTLPTQIFGHKPDRSQVGGKSAKRTQVYLSREAGHNTPTGPFAELKRSVKRIEYSYRFLSEPVEKKIRIKDGVAKLLGTDERTRRIYDFKQAHSSLEDFLKALNRIITLDQKIFRHSGVNLHLTKVQSYLQALRADIKEALSQEHKSTEYSEYKFGDVLGQSGCLNIHDKVIRALGILSRKIAEINPVLARGLNITSPRAIAKAPKAKPIRASKHIVQAPSSKVKLAKTKNVFDFARVLLKIVSDSYAGIVHKIQNALSKITSLASREISSEDQRHDLLGKIDKAEEKFERRNLRKPQLIEQAKSSFEAARQQIKSLSLAA